jgi:hypothetical protein
MERIGSYFPDWAETAVHTPLTGELHVRGRLWGTPNKSAGIVSPAAVPYTERAWISWHLNLEGTHFCKLILCVNQSEED